MKIFSFILALVICLGLFGCAKDVPISKQTEASVSEQKFSETEDNETTTEASKSEEESASGSEEAEQPTEESAEDGSYLVQIPFADQSIFDAPGYDNYFVQTCEVAGTYTIVEEHLDDEGNLWGKLKSGAGWVDLTEVENRIAENAPVSANYADDLLLESNQYLFFSDTETEYSFLIAIRAYETLSDVRLCNANLFGENGLTELYTAEEISPEMPLVANIYLPGDMSAYMLIFKDSEGTEHSYIITSSGRNNTLVFTQYTQ